LLSDTARLRVTDYLLKIATEKPDPLETAVFFLSLAPTDLRPQIISNWRNYLAKHARPGEPVFGPWHDLMQLPDNHFAESCHEVVTRWRSVSPGTTRGHLNPLVQEALANAKLASRADVARAYGGL